MTFKVGDRVRWTAFPEFGEGTVVDPYYDPDYGTVGVRFDDYETYATDTDFHTPKIEELEPAASYGAPTSVSTFERSLREVLSEIQDLLLKKNAAYGDSALNPVRAFSKSDSAEQIRVRIDDKLSRLMRGTEYENEDTVTDLLGYLILLKIAEKR